MCFFSPRLGCKSYIFSWLMCFGSCLCLCPPTWCLNGKMLTKRLRLYEAISSARADIRKTLPNEECRTILASQLDRTFPKVILILCRARAAVRVRVQITRRPSPCSTPSKSMKGLR